MVSNHAKTKYLSVLRAGGIQCNHFHVFEHRSLNHCLLHGYISWLYFPGGLWPFTCHNSGIFIPVQTIGDKNSSTMVAQVYCILLTHVAQRFFWEPVIFQNLLGWWHQKLVSCRGLICNTYTYIWVIPRQITQVPGSHMARLRCFRKITKNTSMCSNDTLFFLDADHKLVFKLQAFKNDSENLLQSFTSKISVFEGLFLTSQWRYLLCVDSWLGIL